MQSVGGWQLVTSSLSFWVPASWHCLTNDNASLLLLLLLLLLHFPILQQVGGWQLATSLLSSWDPAFWRYRT
jgi:hypothetical protein